MRTINPAQVFDFISKLRRNIKGFGMEKDQAKQLSYIREQYALLAIINKVMDGKSYFVGVDHELFKENT